MVETEILTHLVCVQIEQYADKIGEEHKDYAELGPEYDQSSGTVGVSVHFEDESTELMDAAYELGWKKNLDLNSGNPIGIGASASTVYDGRRSTSSSAHIQLATPNLTVMVKSQATKILFEGTKAIGVEVNGNTSVYASKEIILSSGSFDTPKLLLLSGVGPAKELEAHGINIVKDLPGIGKNMQDHCGVFIVDLVDSAMSSRAPFIHNQNLYEDALKQWYEDRTGPLSTHYRALCVAFLKQDHLYDTPEFKSVSEQTKSYLQRPTVPSLEIAFNGPTFPPGYMFGENVTCFSAGAMLMHPESRGSVTLKSKNPFDPPIIDPNYLSHTFDRLAFIDGVREARKLFTETSLKKHWIQPIIVPGNHTDEAIWKFIKEEVISIWHASSTVCMGMADDPMACVDADMKLRGLQNLRAADMSVCPLVISGHTQAVAYQIGQAAAEKIIDEYNLDA
jgi:choline dehydrogenase-like flavoprotein